MKSKKETKEITLKLNYFKSKVDKENGVFYGGVIEDRGKTGGRFCCLDKLGDMCYNFVEVIAYAKITKTKK